MEFIRLFVYVSIYLGMLTTIFYLLGFIGRRKERILNWEPFVSIIIPAFNEEDSLRKTAESALAIDYPKNKFEVIIVNDGSVDRTEKIGKELEKEFSNVKFFSKKNGGKGSALNYGIKRSRGEIIVSLDADSFVTKDALKKMLKYFYSDDIVAVSPGMKVLNPKGFLQRLQAAEYDLGIFLRKAFTNFNAVHVTPGPFSAYRRWFFEKHGGYDENNVTEDMEIAMRIQSLNYKIENCPDALVYTIAPNKFGELARQRKRWYYGVFVNFSKYRKMFGKNYGELGTIFMPMVIISVFFIMFLTGYYSFKFLSDSFRNLLLYPSINFDFIHNLRFDSYSILVKISEFFSDNIFIFSAAFVLFTFLLLVIVNKRVRGDSPISIFINYAIFIFSYSVIYSIWWAISIAQFISGKKLKW